VFHIKIKKLTGFILLIFFINFLSGNSPAQAKQRPSGRTVKASRVVYPEKPLLLDKVAVKLPARSDKNSLKRDILILEQQLNSMTKEFYENRDQVKSNQSEFNRLKSAQDELFQHHESQEGAARDLFNYLCFFAGLFLLISLILLGMLLNTRFNLKKIRKELSAVPEPPVVKANAFADAELEQHLAEKIAGFDSALENNYHNFLEKVNLQLSDKLKIFHNEINTLVEKKALTENPEFGPENVSKLIEKELSKYLQNLVNTEKQIISNIQKVHLANGHFNMGNAFLKKNQFADAITEFSEAIKIDRKFYGAYLNLGKALEKNEQPEDAIKVYNLAIKLKPGYYKAYFNLANLLSSSGMSEEAINSYKKSIELKPDYYKAYNNLGITYQRINRLEDAKEQYREAVKYNKDYPDAYINLSNVERALSKDKTELYPIAEMYMKQFNASNETSFKVKQLINN
jgi:tetratricopeptide (TPR) repeat protein